jgi:Kef-type K+ transport system membrane component KefB
MHGDVALALILMTVGAIAMPAVARKLGIPVAVAEILYGVLIGGAGLGFVRPGDPFLDALSELGFALFLFLAGLEIDFRGFERKGLRALVLPVLLSVGAFAISIGASRWLGWGTWVGLALGATAMPLLLSVVREARLGGTALGGTMITFAAMGELITIVLLSLVELVEASHGDPWHFGEGVLRLIALSGLVVALVVILRTVLWWYPQVFQRMVSHDDPSELGVRVGFGLMLVFVGLALLAQVEPFLGAFIAGALLSFVVREATALEHKLATMSYGFFVPFFFMYVGVRLQVSLSLIVDNISWIVGIIGLMLVSKLVPGALLFARGLRPIEVLATSVLLAAPLTLVIAIMDLGARAGAVSADDKAVVITAGILASLLAPSLARQLLKRVSATDQSERVHAR